MTYSEFIYYGNEESIRAAEIAQLEGRYEPLTSPNEYGVPLYYNKTIRVLYNSQRIEAVLFLIQGSWVIVWLSEYCGYLED